MQLNLLQQLAVDTIEGPVMVIAGAGTGKTQVIAHRIANILAKTDTNPSSILCLTYTDVAAKNMRERLVNIIGTDAARVKICTFHSFCNEIIVNNPEYFSSTSNLKSTDELETIEIIRNIIDKLDNNSPLITSSDRYFYQKNIINNLHLIKREAISVDVLNKLIDDQSLFFINAKNLINKLSETRATKNNYSAIIQIIDQIKSIPNLSTNITGYLSIISSSSENLSDIKTKVKKFYTDLEKDIPKQKELINIFTQYQQELTKRSLYDYEDMILWVKDALAKSPDLLLNYQEKYQYILVDEYQDTNSAQNKIIELLGSYFDHPNIFVVGDDDQSIFRFQGASVENIYNFYQKYNPQKIVLKNNYRSHKLILDSSSSVINHNKNRIANLISDIDKTLVSSVNFDPNPINLTVVNSHIEEDYFVAQHIKKLIDNGEKPTEIAILFRKNKDSVELVKMLTALGIKYYLPSDTDILKSPAITQIIKLFQFIDNTHSSEPAYHILASPFIRLDSVDIVKILKSKISLANLVFDNKLIDGLDISQKSKNTLLKFGKRISKSITDLENYSLDRFFNRVLKRFKILKYILSRNDIKVLNQIDALYKFLKELNRKNNLTLSDFIKRINLYIENDLTINSQPINFDSDGCVKLLTVHGAKGLEFNHVFIYKLLEDSWEKQRDMNKIHLPLGVVASSITKSIEDDYEEDRRLFYVALTRAKKQIYLSYSQFKESGKPQNPSIFISEIDPKLIELVLFNDKELALKTYYSQINTNKFDPKLSDYLYSYLQKSYKFNVSHLNSYLRCPLCFYYKTILHIPQNKEKSGSFGTAIHSALAQLYLHKFSKEEIIAIFDQALKLEHLPPVDHLYCQESGHKVLSEYYDHYINSIETDNISEYNFSNDNISFDNIPLTGKIDLITKPNNNSVTVTDFKTGKPDNKYKELSPDGEYFRQLVFYKLLLDIKGDSRLKFGQGVIDFVEKNKKGEYTRRVFDITPDDVENLKKLIKEVYQKIQNLDFFSLGPDCPDHQHLHYLLKK